MFLIFKIYSIKMKKLLIIFLFTIWLTFLANTVSAQDVNFEVIPESDQNTSNIGKTVTNIWEGGKVWDKYKDTAYGEKKWWDWSDARVRKGSDMSLWDQFASGVMTWDTILDYAVYLVKFIGQLALLAWALWIIYLWYKKATEHLKFEWNLGKVVIWIVVISFAYVIVKIIWSMFIS